MLYNQMKKTIKKMILVCKGKGKRLRVVYDNFEQPPFKEI